MENNYHFGKIVTWHNGSPHYKHKYIHFAEGGVHTVVYNNEINWISSVYVDARGRTHERVEYIDDKGEVSTGFPFVVVDVYGNQFDLLAFV
jgi:hypothetical protein